VTLEWPINLIIVNPSAPPQTQTRAGGPPAAIGPFASLFLTQCQQEGGAKFPHKTSSLRAKKRATMAVVCSQPCASLASCFLPARVSL
jgi:hypothetical protein